MKRTPNDLRRLRVAALVAGVTTLVAGVVAVGIWLHGAGADISSRTTVVDNSSSRSAANSASRHRLAGDANAMAIAARSVKLWEPQLPSDVLGTMAPSEQKLRHLLWRWR